MKEIITLDHGSGGEKTARLIDELLRPRLQNEILDAMGDGAILPQSPGRLAFSTDSFVVSPLIFPGGDIGKLAVCGTVNDLAMCGARPKWLSLSLIIEEGLEKDTLNRVLDSIAQAAREAEVQVVTGDTKVVERGKGDGLYINTTGIGEVAARLDPKTIQVGDAVLVTGPIGDHAAAIMLARNELGLAGDVKSDCMNLYPLARAAWETGAVRCLRDATRGGVATTLNEFAQGQDYGICLWEECIPVRGSVAAACDMLGLDPLYCANEGRMLVFAQGDRKEEVLQALQRVPGGEESCIIGEVTQHFEGRVVVRGRLGAHRIVNKLTGAQLPRIC